MAVLGASILQKPAQQKLLRAGCEFQAMFGQLDLTLGLAFTPNCMPETSTDL
jgi:hypothetical protein